MRERSPGAAAPPTPWRIVKQQPLPAAPQHRYRSRRTWRAPATAIFCLGVVAGLVIAVYAQRQPTAAQADVVIPEQQVLCDGTPTGPGYTYSKPVADPPRCSNGAASRILG